MKSNRHKPGTRSGATRTRQNKSGVGSLSWLMDSSIPLPWGFRIGLDGIIGLIPGVGDAIGGGLSTWIFYQAYKKGVPNLILLRMLLNILVDTLLGAIPVLGDLFDFFWKANLKNASLLENYQRDPTHTYRRNALTTILFILGLVLILGLFIYLAFALLAVLWEALTR